MWKNVNDRKWNASNPVEKKMIVKLFYRML